MFDDNVLTTRKTMFLAIYSTKECVYLVFTTIMNDRVEVNIFAKLGEPVGEKSS